MARGPEFELPADNQGVRQIAAGDLIARRTTPQGRGARLDVLGYTIVELLESCPRAVHVSFIDSGRIPIADPHHR